MKKQVTAILFTAIIIALSATVFGQQRKIQSATEKIKIETIYGYYNGEKKGVDANGTRTYNYYYEGNGKKVLHGAFTESAKGENKLYYTYNYRLKSIDAKKTFSFSATYKDGELDGAVNLKYSDYGLYELIALYPGKVEGNISGYFNNGVPTGKWKYDMGDDLNSDLNHPKYKFSGTVTYENGKITAFTTDDVSITYDKEGRASGKLEDITLTNGIANTSSMNDKQKQIIDKFNRSEIVINNAPCKPISTLNVVACIDGYLLRKNQKNIELYKHQYPHDSYSDKILKILPFDINVEYYTLEEIQEATLNDCGIFCKWFDDCSHSGIDGYKFIMDNSYLIVRGRYNDQLLYVSDEIKEKVGKLPVVQEKYAPKYNSALNAMNKYKGENSIREMDALSEAANLFNEIYYYSDSKEKEEYCKNKASEIREAIAEREYLNASNMIKQSKNIHADTTTLKTYREIKKSLERIADYKDAKLLLEECNKLIENISEPIYYEALNAIYGPSIKYITDYLINEVNMDYDYDALASGNRYYEKMANYNKLDKVDINKIPYDKCISASAFETYKRVIPIFKILGDYKDSYVGINICEKILAGSENEIKQLKSIRNSISFTLKETVELTKNKKTGKIHFYGAASYYYKRFDFKGLNVDNNVYAQSLVLDNTIGSLCPMVDYRIIDVFRNAKDDYCVAKCQIDKKISSKTEEYETYECTFILFDDKIMVKSLSGAAKKIRP